MGRTNATFRHLLQGIRERWRDYRRGLRARDQPHFDRLFEHADAHADASGYRNPEDPMDAVLLSMLLEHEKRLADLEDRGAAAPGEQAGATLADGVATDGESRVRGSDRTDDEAVDPDAADQEAVDHDVTERDTTERGAAERDVTERDVTERDTAERDAVEGTGTD